MNIVKKKSLITEFYTLDGCIVWYINHISIKLLNNQISEMKNKREKLSQNVEDSNRSDKMKDKEATKRQQRASRQLTGISGDPKARGTSHK